jgi:hypothetical protein
MAFFPPGQGRKGQGIRAGQVEKKCPVDITAAYSHTYYKKLANSILPFSFATQNLKIE